MNLLSLAGLWSIDTCIILFPTLALPWHGVTSNANESYRKNAPLLSCQQALIGLSGPTLFPLPSGELWSGPVRLSRHPAVCVYGTTLEGCVWSEILELYRDSSHPSCESVDWHIRHWLTSLSCCYPKVAYCISWCHNVWRSPRLLIYSSLVLCCCFSNHLFQEMQTGTLHTMVSLQHTVLKAWLTRAHCSNLWCRLINKLLASSIIFSCTSIV